MRLAALGTMLVLAALAVGWSNGRADIDSIAVSREGEGTVRALEQVKPNGREAPLSSVLPLVPDVLPAPLPDSGSCGGDRVVEIRLADGTSARYGPCRLPDDIGRLASAVVYESHQWAAAAVAETKIVGARPAEERARRRILATMGQTRISLVRLLALRQLPGWRGWKLPGSDQVLVLRAGESLRGNWEAQLFATEYAAATARPGLRHIVLLRIPNHGELRLSAVGLEAGPPSVDLAPVRGAVSEAGVRIVELRRVADGLALTLRADDPAAFLKTSGARVLRTLTNADRVAYFAVQDAGGTIVSAGGWWASGGSIAVRPDLYSCGPLFRLSEPFGATHPPCPASRFARAFVSSRGLRS